MGSHTDSLLVRRLSDGFSRALNALGHLLVRLDAPPPSQPQLGGLPTLPPLPTYPSSSSNLSRTPSIDHNLTHEYPIPPYNHNPSFRASRFRGRRSQSNSTTTSTMNAAAATTTRTTGMQDKKSPPASPLSSSDDDSAARHRRNKLLQQKQRRLYPPYLQNNDHHNDYHDPVQYKQGTATQPKDSKSHPFIQGSPSDISPIAASAANLLRQNSSPAMNPACTSVSGGMPSLPTRSHSLSPSLRRRPSLPPPDLPSTLYPEHLPVSAFRRRRASLESPNDHQSSALRSASALRRRSSLEGVQYPVPQMNRKARSQRSPPNRRASLEVSSREADNWDELPTTRHHRTSLDSATLQKGRESLDGGRREPLEPLPASLFRRGSLSRRSRVPTDFDPDSSTPAGRTCPEQIQMPRRNFDYRRLLRPRPKHIAYDGYPGDNALHTSNTRSEGRDTGTGDSVVDDLPENYGTSAAVPGYRTTVLGDISGQREKVVHKTSVDDVFNTAVPSRWQLEPTVSDSSSAGASCRKPKGRDEESSVCTGPHSCPLLSVTGHFDTSPASSRSSLVCEIGGTEAAEPCQSGLKSPAVSPMFSSRRVRFAEDL